MSTPQPGHRRLVLASTSRYRRELLARLELPFDAAAPDFDELAEEPRFAELGPERFALHLARGKAESLRAGFPDAWILAADQVAVIGGEGPDEGPPELLHKPGDEARAIAQLLRLRGRTHRLISGIVLVDGASGETHELVDRQRLRMRAFSEAEASEYVRRHRPLDCVGSYRIEDAGIKLFAAIESADFTGIIGLPLIAVGQLLREVGLLPR
ncbi:MAG: Maf-like protein [Myxococcales bacterium]|nr:Maf-like protein [Myxococcales bacterium]MCB9568676.1 Maf-like protein [Myxococcales bacterium]MCB9705951.1 Maf-like protein [Myxococcales bacterium]